MKLDVYDFDKTIYDGDSSVDFFKFCLKRHKVIIFKVPKIVIGYLQYYLKLISKKELKEKFFSFLSNINNIDFELIEFWKHNKRKIKKFYLEKALHENDIVISASPEFLLKPICDELEVKDLLASIVDKKSGKFLSENCKGKEKVKRIKEKYKNIKIQKMYTDSYSDQPLIDLAQEAYLVNRNDITKIK